MGGGGGGGGGGGDGDWHAASNKTANPMTAVVKARLLIMVDLPWCYSRHILTVWRL
jgi:hypothetical protein